MKHGGNTYYEHVHSLPFTGWSNVTESMVTIRSPCCEYNLAWSVELKGEDLSSYSHKIESVYENVRMITTHTHTHPFNGPLSGTTRVSQYQKGKPIWILVKQETVSGSGIGWTICKSAPRFRQITTTTPHCSVFYRPDALPAAQPTSLPIKRF